MRSLLTRSRVTFIPAAAVLAACQSGAIINGGVPYDSGSTGPVVQPDGQVVAGPGGSVGAACSSSTPCRSGLACTDGTCEFGHSQAEGSKCSAAGECKSGLQCVAAPGGAVCTPAGSGKEGDGCAADINCESGLRCGFFGLGLACVKEGTTDVGGSCATSGDCYAGLVCRPSSSDAGGGMACQPTLEPNPAVPGSGSAIGLPVAPKLACDDISTGDVTAHFQVPGAEGSDPNGDFFRLPFPNDARIKNGKIDLKGFPTPGASLLGFDPVQVYLDAITSNEQAWGAYSTIIFRFSGHIDFDSFASGVILRDITDPQVEGNNGTVWGHSSEGGRYVCHDWLAVRPPPGSPFVPGHTYAAFLTTVGLDCTSRDSQQKCASKKSIKRSPQLAAVLGATAPVDPALANTYAKFKPLRDWLPAHGFSPSGVLNASVFTIADVQAPMKRLAAAVRVTPAPTASQWIKCDGTAKSPCPQAEGSRACTAGTADYDEYHALVSIPVFQKGTAPYFDSGGDIDSSGVVRTEQVCMALTVPKKAAPAAGYPVTVFAHGTGGSFRAHIRDEVAGALARATPPVAVLGYDQVEHGPRRGASTMSPNVLFFNFKNPAAARGNPMQGAADVISVGRFAKSFGAGVTAPPPAPPDAGASDGGTLDGGSGDGSAPTLDAGSTPPPSGSGGPAGVKFDTTSVVFFGHSQGSMHGSVGLPFTNDYRAALLSGNGASLMDALLTKTQPENIAAAVPFALGGDYDGARKLFGGRDHPVLTILQQWIDPADPLNFAKAIASQPGTGVLPKSVFQTYGLGDTYSPPVTLETYALAAQLELAVHDPSVSSPDPIAEGTLTEKPVPIAGNFSGTPTVTAAMRQYQAPSGSDGHFVVFDVPSANQDAIRFLSMAASGKVPAVGK